MSRRTAAAALLAATAACIAAGCGGAGDNAAAPASHPTERGLPKLAGAAVLPGSPALDFSLRDAYGRAVSLSGQRGRVVLLTFLYTQCRDVCPIIADHLNTVLRELGPARRRGNRDRRHRRSCSRHARRGPRLHPAAQAAAGVPFRDSPRSELRRVWQNYNVLAIARNEDVVDHSAPTLVIDRGGRPVSSTCRASPTDVLHDVRQLLPAGLTAGTTCPTRRPRTARRCRSTRQTTSRAAYEVRLTAHLDPAATAATVTETNDAARGRPRKRDPVGRARS